MKIKIYDILFWILFVLAVIFALGHIFGNSPTIEQALLILVISILFKFQSEIIKNTKETTVLKNSFINLAKDFKEHIQYK